MIPILYEADEKDFITNGLGRLPDTITCTVEENRNGSYELEMEYPVSGLHFSDLNNERIIYATPAENKSPQPFIIYKIEKRSEGSVVISAHHLSYLLQSSVCIPFKSTTASDALVQISEHTRGFNGFTYWTNKITSADFELEEPREVRKVLGGSDGSILETYGGEYEFDKWTVKLWDNRGADNGFTLRYGKNITSLESETDTSSVYTGVMPYWKGTIDEEDIFITTLKPVFNEEHKDDYVYEKVLPLDLSSVFSYESDDPHPYPTQEELEEVAVEYLKSNSPWKPNENLTVDFVQLAQTEEYKNFALLQRVNLCDTVKVIYEPLGIVSSAKVIRTRYNVLLDRYDEIEIGEPTSNLSDAINQSVNIDEKLEEQETWLEAAIERSSNLIKGGLGGYVVMKTNANGQPEEILIMDAPKKEDAVNVIRMNQNGIGFSTNGYYGVYRNAWTIDGVLNADFINAGTMSANRINGGTLKVGGQDNGDGVVRVYNQNGDEVVSMTRDGLSVTQANINVETPSESTSVINLWNKTAGNYRYLTSMAPWMIHVDYDYEKRSAWMTPYGFGVESTTGYGYAVSNYQENATIGGNCTVGGNISAKNLKSRIVGTENYGSVLQYCYEMPSPMFGDFGTATLDESGLCYLYFEEIFKQTVNTTRDYYVTLTPYADSKAWIEEKSSEYCLIKGTPGAKFDWEIKVRQNGSGFENLRLENYDENDPDGANQINDFFVDYDLLADEYLNSLEEEFYD